jgi:hypothetical protein
VDASFGVVAKGLERVRSGGNADENPETKLVPVHSLADLFFHPLRWYFGTSTKAVALNDDRSIGIRAFGFRFVGVCACTKSKN